MQEYRLYLGLVAVVVLGCSKSNAVEGELDSGGARCYLQVSGRDTIQLAIHTAETGIDGTLHFLFYEKDKTTGSLKGKMIGDTLVAHYTFTSEGQTSTRQVAFLKQDHGFIMGYGEILNSNHSDIFRDRTGIGFTDKVLLKEVACD